jgi:hypothetical protein
MPNSNERNGAKCGETDVRLVSMKDFFGYFVLVLPFLDSVVPK